MDMPDFVSTFVSLSTLCVVFTFGIMNNAAVNICIQSLLWTLLNSLGFIPRRGNAGSFGNSVLGTAKLFSTAI